MSVMSYQGHAARVEFDADDKIFVGYLAGINDVIGFHAKTVDDPVAAFHATVEDYLAACQSLGKSAEKPTSGKLMLRAKPEVHARAALAAQLAGMSMNQWSEDAPRSAARSVLPE